MSRIVNSSVRYTFFLPVVLLFGQSTAVAEFDPGAAKILFVSPDGDGTTGLTWETAFPSIGESLVASASGDEIWVQSGTYNESISAVTGVALYGGFAGAETLRDERDWAVNATVIDATGLDTRVIIIDDFEDVSIDGFTITGGSYIETSTSSSHYNGGGVYINSVISATVSNCTITDNTASYNGGGVYCSSGSPHADQLHDHGQHGRELRRRSVVRLALLPDADQLHDQDNTGGGVSCSGSPTLTNCTITGNTAGRIGGGVICSGSPTLTNCKITGNTALSGGGVRSFGSASTSRRKYPSRGGGVYHVSGSTILTNCTITGNTAEEGVGCIASVVPRR